MYHGRLNSAVSPSIFYSRLEHRHRTLHATYWRVVDSTNSIHRSTRPDPKLVSMRRHASIVLGSSPLPLLHRALDPSVASLRRPGRYPHANITSICGTAARHQALRQTVQQQGLFRHGMPRVDLRGISREQMRASALVTPRPTHRARTTTRSATSAGRTSRTTGSRDWLQGDVVRGDAMSASAPRFGTADASTAAPRWL